MVILDFSQTSNKINSFSQLKQIVMLCYYKAYLMQEKVPLATLEKYIKERTNLKATRVTLSLIQRVATQFVNHTSLSAKKVRQNEQMTSLTPNHVLTAVKGFQSESNVDELEEHLENYKQQKKEEKKAKKIVINVQVYCIWAITPSLSLRCLLFRRLRRYV